MNRFADEAAFARGGVLARHESCDPPMAMTYATRYVTILRSYRLKVIRENGSYRGAKGCCGDGAGLLWRWRTNGWMTGQVMHLTRIRQK
jgi:hypothetical protein